jgi:hypothetical protein
MPKKPQKSWSKRSQADLSKSLDLLTDLRFLIEQTRAQVAQTVNSELVVLYWQIGVRIRADILQNERAEYGKEIFSTLSGK